MKKYVLKIKDMKIPYCIKNYKTSKSIKIIFKEDILTITKSPYVSIKEAENFIYKNEENIYEFYKKVEIEKATKKTIWENGESILYKGELYKIEIQYIKQDLINIQIDNEQKKFKIFMSEKCIGKEEEFSKKIILKIYKQNTEKILYEKLPYWSDITGINYNSFKVRDAKTKYGSCKTKTKDLHFTSRLIMLKDEAIDAVIVHELCHIIYPNHSKDFYNLVLSFIPNYKQLDKYLKECSKYVRAK